jgi:hypothetical protein
MSPGIAKQPAITKHPKGTASFCIRVCADDGATVEYLTFRPVPIAEIIASLEGDYLGYLRAMLPKAEPTR